MPGQPTGSPSGFSKNITNGQRAAIAVVGLAVLTVLGMGLVWGLPVTYSDGYAPKQPIPFSHKLHAGENKIPCLYCHVGADKSKHASVPSMNVCMNCHNQVKTDSPLIQQVAAAYNEGRAIEWVRIHELPDFVHFPHNRHISAGVSCQTCHGNVQAMDVVAQENTLSMGWCMDCHRGKTTPRGVLASKYPNHPDPRGLPVAPTECSTCHK